MFMEYFPNVFLNSEEVLSSEFFYFPPLSITVVNLTSTRNVPEKNEKKEKKEKN